MNAVAETKPNELATPADQSTAVISMIERVALDPNADINKLEKMLDMQERVLNRQQEQAFNAAMAKAQSEMGRVSADSNNNQTKSKYASYGALDKALRPIYSQNGFALSFGTTETQLEQHVRVTCDLSHVDGHSKHFFIDMPADGLGAKGNAMMTKTHAAGSAVSYGMRYLLKMIFNVAVGENDDDGNAASLPTVSENQAANIQALLDEIDSKHHIGFFVWMKVDAVEKIPAKFYQTAINALENKRKEVAQ